MFPQTDEPSDYNLNFRTRWNGDMLESTYDVTYKGKIIYKGLWYSHRKFCVQDAEAMKKELASKHVTELQE